MAKLASYWQKWTKCHNISFRVKLRLLRSIVISVFIYGCESSTYNEEIVTKINAFEFKCCRRLLGIPWKDTRRNMSVKKQVKDFARLQKLLIQIAQGTSHPSELKLANIIMHGHFSASRGKTWQATKKLDDGHLWMGSEHIHSLQARIKTATACLRILKNLWRKRRNSSKQSPKRF